MIEQVLPTYQLSAEIIQLVKDSREFCFLVSPYYQPWPLFTRTLERAAREEKNLVFILRAGDQHSPDLSYLNTDFGFDLVYVKGLHAKLYISEKTAILSSMNLYDSSKEHGVELGYKTDSRRLIRELVESVIQDDILGVKPASVLKGRFFDNIGRLYKEPSRKLFRKDESLVIEEPEIDERDLSQHKKSKDAKGYCIRCRKVIPMSVYRTFCDDCFAQWSASADHESKEHYCHMCGKEAQVSKTRALCYDCYNDLEVW
ncbi:MAG: hypothetical protein JXB03_01920 [Spirochaetales bacterium]|nr:hypothetical protein [Spirochaetales bacterium]